MSKLGNEKRIQNVVVVALIKMADAVLLVRRLPNDEIAPNRFHLPGGHVEWGEDPAEALIREVREEVGITVVPEKVLHTFKYVFKDVHTVGITFQCSIKGSNDLKIDTNEVQASKWLTFDEAIKHFPEGDHDRIALEAAR
jgi:8-oxo-dGTP diphosphatase